MLLKLIVNFFLFSLATHVSLAQTNATVVKKGARYDTIIRKHVDKPIVKSKPVQKQQTQPTSQQIILPTPEFVNQPYYYNKDSNRLVKLETATAQLVTKKKTLGLKGAKQFFSMDDASSKIRFTSKPNTTF